MTIKSETGKHFLSHWRINLEFNDKLYVRFNCSVINVECNGKLNVRFNSSVADLVNRNSQYTQLHVCLHATKVYTVITQGMIFLPLSPQHVSIVIMGVDGLGEQSFLAIENAVLCPRRCKYLCCVKKEEYIHSLSPKAKFSLPFWNTKLQSDLCSCQKLQLFLIKLSIISLILLSSMVYRGDIHTFLKIDLNWKFKSNIKYM